LPRIFVCYRRTDAPAHAGRIYDRLVERFGTDNVYRDLDSTTPGADFAEVINETIAKCDALVAVIGRHWRSVAPPWHRGRWQDHSQDWVLREIAAALERNVRVVPVLVEGATMPHSDELPEDVKMFARRHALELSETVWALPLDRLMDSLAAGPAPSALHGEALTAFPAPAHRSRRTRVLLRRLRAAAAVIIVCGLAIGGFIIMFIDGGETDVGSSAVKREARPLVAESLSVSEYRLQATTICAEYRRESKRIGDAEGDRVVLGSHVQLESRITDKLGALKPPRPLLADHRRVLALWGRRLSLMGYYYDRVRQALSDPVFRREFTRQVKRINELARQIDGAFGALDLTPECSLLS
jgi:TIR domain